MMPLDDGPNLGLGRVVQARSANLRHVAHPQQAIDAAQLLQFALMQNRDPIANVLHVGQQVAAHHDRLPLGLELQNQVLHLAGADRVQTAGRLVEQDQLRIVDQRLGQADAPGHAFGILAQLPPLGPIQADHVDQLGRPLRGARPRAC